MLVQLHCGVDAVQVTWVDQLLPEIIPSQLPPQLPPQQAPDLATPLPPQRAWREVWAAIVDLITVPSAMYPPPAQSICKRTTWAASINDAWRRRTTAQTETSVLTIAVCALSVRPVLCISNCISMAGLTRGKPNWLWRVRLTFLAVAIHLLLWLNMVMSVGDLACSGLSLFLGFVLELMMHPVLSCPLVLHGKSHSWKSFHKSQSCFVVQATGRRIEMA